MSQFEYVVRTKEGEIKKGILEAPNKNFLARRLRDRGLILTFADEIKTKKFSLAGFITGIFGVPEMEKLLFTRHLSIMLKAGLSLSRAFSILSEQTRNRRFKKILERVKEDVEGGKSFADTLFHQKIFTPLYVNMVRVGELGGNLSKVLDLLSIQMIKSHNLKGKIKGAMIYPALVFLTMIGVGVAMMIFVVPKLVEIFEGFDVELPLATRMLIGFTNFFNKYWYLFLIGSVIIAVWLKWFLGTIAGKKIWHKIILITPFIKKMSMRINITNFSRNLSLLIKSGMPIVESLNVIATTFKNIYFEKAILDASEKVKKGIDLSESLEKYPHLFSPLVLQMIVVGEETGNLDDILSKIADFYEEETDQQMKNISSIIEPVLMIVVGLAVGFMAISIISPIYSLMSQI